KVEADVAAVGCNKCRLHGGASLTVRKRVEEQKHALAAEAAITRLIGPSRPVMDPAAELAKVVGGILAKHYAAQQLVADLERQTDGEDVGSGLLTVTSSGLDMHPFVKF